MKNNNQKGKQLNYTKMVIHERLRREILQTKEKYTGKTKMI